MGSPSALSWFMFGVQGGGNGGDTKRLVSWVAEWWCTAAAGMYGGVGWFQKFGGEVDGSLVGGEF